MDRLKQLYKATIGSEPTSIIRLTGSGSNRQYFRLTGVPNLIGVIGLVKEENNAFIRISQDFSLKRLPVPKVVAVSDDGMAYLQEDLGNELLFDRIASGRQTGDFSDEEIFLLVNTIRELAHIHYRGPGDNVFSWCYPVAEFDRRSIMWDLNYFKYCFLRNCGIEVDEPALESDFKSLADELLAKPFNTFMYRDFQSRNVMIVDNKPRFIDFQGGRRGPAEYDLASFLWQAKANFSDKLRIRLVEEYLISAMQYEKIDRDSFLRRLKLFVMFRTLQVLGAYGLRGIVERKAHFIESIPLAVKNLADLRSQGILNDYPELERIAGVIIEKFPMPEKRTSLLVTLMSFSYKQGLPADNTGNGGGYVFDCRGMHNPGRYDEYKPLTGRDKPVIDFLEERGEVQTFLSHAEALVDASVDTYLRRGFTNLFVGFGCTGGRHRSVYCAEQMARHLSEKYGVEIALIHREQHIEERLNKK